MRTRHLLPTLVLVLAVTALVVGEPPAAAGSSPESHAATFSEGVRKVNEAHARKPGDTREAELAGRLPRRAGRALGDLLRIEEHDDLAAALVTAGEAALDLDLMEQFAQVRERLAVVSPEDAARLGVAISRERFQVRGLGGLEKPWLERFADVLDAVLDAYDDLYAFAEWSKVPGKKIRFRVHLEERITRPPHFAPQFPFHSEVDFPVADGEAFTSPTPDGKFLFYGLCHELGHLIAMWGDRSNEEDHHAWAHYTGVAVLDHLASQKKLRKLLKGLDDARARSLDRERKRIEKEGIEPSRKDRAGVLALLVALHDGIGPAAIGAAMNHLDEEGRDLRINHVRYRSFDRFRDALLEVVKSKRDRRTVRELLDD